MSWTDELKMPDDYHEAKELAYWRVMPYWVQVSTLGHYEREDICYIVEIYNGGVRVRYSTFDTEDKAMACFRNWTQEILPVQMAKEAHGLTRPLRPLKDAT